MAGCEDFSCCTQILRLQTQIFPVELINHILEKVVLHTNYVKDFIEKERERHLSLKISYFGCMLNITVQIPRLEAQSFWLGVVPACIIRRIQTIIYSYRWTHHILAMVSAWVRGRGSDLYFRCCRIPENMSQYPSYQQGERFKLASSQATRNASLISPRTSRRLPIFTLNTTMTINIPKTKSRHKLNQHVDDIAPLPPGHSHQPLSSCRSTL